MAHLLNQPTVQGKTELDLITRGQFKDFKYT